MDETTVATAGTGDYEVTVVRHEPGLADMKQTTAGGAKTTAAWLRALADEIDPPRPAQPTKPTCRCATPRGVAPEPTGVITVQQDPRAGRRGTQS